MCALQGVGPTEDTVPAEHLAGLTLGRLQGVSPAPCCWPWWHRPQEQPASPKGQATKGGAAGTAGGHCLTTGHGTAVACWAFTWVCQNINTGQ